MIFSTSPVESKTTPTQTIESPTFPIIIVTVVMTRSFDHRTTANVKTSERTCTPLNRLIALNIIQNTSHLYLLHKTTTKYSVFKKYFMRRNLLLIIFVKAFRSWRSIIGLVKRRTLKGQWMDRVFPPLLLTRETSSLLLDPYPYLTREEH